jgi:hypothetical protein
MSYIKGIKLEKGSDIASAAALTIPRDGNYFDVTGTTTVTSINTVAIDTVVTLQFDAAVTLTHHATDLILPSGANITTAAGDEFTFLEYAAGDWKCIAYVLADGTAIAATSDTFSSEIEITSGVTSGAATSGFLAATNNMVEYEIQGGGAGDSKIIYYSCIVPANYASGGTIKIDSWTTDNVGLTTWTLTAYINGTVDASINATDISPGSDTTYETTSTSFGSTLSPGDVLEIKLNFTGSSGDDVRLRRVTFEYNS